MELARDTKGNDVAQELAEAREKTEIAVAKANLLIQQREGTENDLCVAPSRAQETDGHRGTTRWKPLSSQLTRP